MKKIFQLCFALLLAAPAFSCDICGCGAGSGYIGILPEFHDKIFGVRYRYNFLESHIGAGGATTYLTTHEYYRTAEFWGGWTINNKYRLMATIPVSNDLKKTGDGSESKSGLGDISLSAWYAVMNNRKTIGHKLFVQSLWAGLGIKLPTGKYETASKGEDINEAANLFQLGTASTDFTANLMYDARLNDAGLNIAASYKMNTENSSEYRYGNKISANAQAYYKFRLQKKLLISPNAGLLVEHSDQDFDHGFKVFLSGGNLVEASAGAEVAFSNVVLGANFQQPLSQDLGKGFLRARNRGMVHLGIAF